jgi:hypothetical protein
MSAISALCGRLQDRLNGDFAHNLPTFQSEVPPFAMANMIVHACWGGQPCRSACRGLKMQRGLWFATGAPTTLTAVCGRHQPPVALTA